jgi:hypothetical protein
MAGSAYLRSPPSAETGNYHLGVVGALGGCRGLISASTTDYTETTERYSGDLLGGVRRGAVRR